MVRALPLVLFVFGASLSLSAMHSSSVTLDQTPCVSSTSADRFGPCCCDGYTQASTPDGLVVVAGTDSSDTPLAPSQEGVTSPEVAPVSLPTQCERSRASSASLSAPPWPVGAGLGITLPDDPALFPIPMLAPPPGLTAPALQTAPCHHELPPTVLLCGLGSLPPIASAASQYDDDKHAPFSAFDYAERYFSDLGRWTAPSYTGARPFFPLMVNLNVRIISHL